MATKRMRELESKLSFQQRRAAQLIVENELVRDITSKKKTFQDIADEVGVARMSIYRWRTRNSAFIEYMNMLADDILSSHRSEVYAQLLTLIRGTSNGAPSVKAIDLFLRRFGLLTERKHLMAEILEATKIFSKKLKNWTSC